ncbi:MAG: LysM peptidoglycan-binding domain-containing protein [Verrucomicrobiales bacterium]|nr:LysM peptidoglycan-binding domain-containing protein [Verrucomicrobiales bacterium]
MKVYLRLLFALISLGVLSLCLIVVHYIWNNQIEPERQLQIQVNEIKKLPKIKIDHGSHLYEEAVSLIQTGALLGGIEKLHELIKYYPESKYFDESNRIIGEVNSDHLLSRDSGEGKKEYTVKRGDALRLIAQKHETTVGYILHVNGRMGSKLQPGDQLIVCPLRFSILINLKAKTIVLRNSEDKLFKSYELVGSRLPQACPSSFDSLVKGLIVGDGTRFVEIGSTEYVNAAKEIRCERRGISMRSLTGIEDKDKYATGFFVSHDDIEELALLVRSGSPIHVRK